MASPGSQNDECNLNHGQRTLAIFISMSVLRKRVSCFDITIRKVRGQTKENIMRLRYSQKAMAALAKELRRASWGAALVFSSAGINLTVLLLNATAFQTR